MTKIIIGLIINLYIYLLCSLPFIMVIRGWYCFRLIARDGKTEKRCRYLLKGTVIDNRIVTSKRGSAYNPRFGYTFNGREYKAETPYATFVKRFEAGDEVDIYIDEKHPEIFWIPSEAEGLNRINKMEGTILTGLGGAFIVVEVGAFINSIVSR